jgi:conjugative transposon TraN protein
MIIVMFFVAVFFGITKPVSAQQIASFTLHPAGVVQVLVSTGRITNLIFPGPVRTGIKVSNDILVQKVNGVENVVELKAMRKGFPPTSVSVFSAAGRVYSFMVEYSDTAKDFDFFVGDDPAGRSDASTKHIGTVPSGMQVDAQTLQMDVDTLSGIQFMHHSVRYAKVRLRLRGIYLKDGLLWLMFDLQNRSQVPYRIDFLRVYSAGSAKVKRTAAHEAEISPKYLPALPVVSGKAETPFCAAFAPFTLVKGERLCVEVGEANGGRTMKLRVKSKILLKARS